MKKRNACIMAFTLLAATSQAGVVRHYSFDGNLNDNSVNADIGTITGTETYGTGQFGQALNASGANYMRFTELSFTTAQDWSISLWYQATATNTADLIGDYNALNSTLTYNPDGAADRNYYLRTGHRSDEATWTATEAPTAIDTGVWHHLVISSTGTGNNLKFYEDGVEISGWNSVDDTAMTIDTIAYGGQNGSFNGLIDEVWITDTALTSTEVNSLYTTNTIPEPATLGFILTAGSGIIFIRRRLML